MGQDAWGRVGPWGLDDRRRMHAYKLNCFEKQLKLRSDLVPPAARTSLSGLAPGWLAPCALSHTHMCTPAWTHPGPEACTQIQHGWLTPMCNTHTCVAKSSRTPSLRMPCSEHRVRQNSLPT